MSADAASATPPWHAAYPKPSNPAPPAVTAEEIRRRFDDGNLPGKTYVLVDLRRNDHEVSRPGSVALPRKYFRS